MTESSQYTDSLDIAIVGMAGRFPGAANVDQFWGNLCGGIESIRAFSDEELRQAGVDDEWLRDPNFVKSSPVLDDCDKFDAALFGYSPREAAMMDPQQRLLLECAAAALDSAGHDPARFDGRIGVFAGAAMNTYFIDRDLARSFHRDYIPTLIGNDKDFLATRISFKLNLTGPSISVQTACSTSLVAVHLACQSLLNDECELALAGGVSVRVPQTTGYLYQEGSILSPDGHVRPFDARAGGTVFGSGVGVVALRRLSDAVRDRDAIFAVIKGSAVNNDGSSKAHFTSPSISAQSEVISEALAAADVEPDMIGYVEAHGTGTYLGDPIEIEALTRAFGDCRRGTEPCAIGSVKANVGHLDAAAGVTGLIKTALALKHGVLPPSINFSEPNPQIDFVHSPFYVNAELKPWQTADGPRRAGVSSLGIGGTNAHVVLEQPPAVTSKRSNRKHQLFTISANTPEAVETSVANLAAHFQQSPRVDPADAAFTLQTGRRQYANRSFAVCDQDADIASQLEARDRVTCSTSAEALNSPDVAFLFSGMGSQHVHMTERLYENEPVFRQHLDRSVEILQPILKLDIRHVLYPDARNEDTANALQETSLAQPILVAVELALAQLWRSWGVEPAAMLGHSIGEYTAAAVAGVLSHHDVLELVAFRGRLIGEIPRGAMLAVSLPPDELCQRITGELSLAVINGPENCVVGGSPGAIKQLEDELTTAGIGIRALQVNHAFHSYMLDPILEKYERFVARIPLSPPQIPYISNLTGTWITADDAATPGYWARHLRQTVQFSAGLAELMSVEARVFLEVGPSTVLTTLARLHPAFTDQHRAVPSLPHPSNETGDDAFCQAALGHIWAAGVEVDWAAYHAPESRCRVPLPEYPYQRTRHWIAPAPRKQRSVDAGVGGTQTVLELLAAGDTQQAAERLIASGLSGDATRVLPELLRAMVEESGPSDRETAASDLLYTVKWLPSATGPVGRSTQSLSDPHQITAGLAPRVVEKCGPAMSPAATESGQWLILADDRGIGQAFAERLRSRGNACTLFRKGRAFRRLSDGEYVVDPGSRDQIERLFQAAAGGSAKRFDGVVHLWGLDAEMTSTSEGDNASPLMFGCTTALSIVQTLTDDSDRPCPLWLITQNAQRVIPTDDVSGVVQSGLIGIRRVIGREHPELRCVAVDLPTCSPSDAADMLVREVGSLDGESEIAYRGQQRYLARLSPFAQAGTDSSHAIQLDQGRTYLITGGLGRFGQVLASWMVEHGARHLVLVGRRGATRKSHQQVAALQAAGAQVRIVAADVSQRAEVSRLLDEISRELPPLAGIIHAAMVLDDVTIANLSPQQFARVMAPKAVGAWHLHDLTRELDLDFFMCCSSISSIVGTPGQASYVAANFFTEALSEHRRASGLASLTIDLPLMEDINEDDNRLEDYVRRMQAAGIGALNSAAVLRVLESVWDSTHAHLAIMPVDWETHVLAYPAGAPSLFSDLVRESHEAMPTAQASVHTADRLAAAVHTAEGEERKRLVGEYLRVRIAETLGLRESQLTEDAVLVHLGLDSLMAIRLRNEVRSDLAIALPLKELLKNQPIRSLSDFVCRELELGSSRPDLALPAVAFTDHIVEGEI